MTAAHVAASILFFWYIFHRRAPSFIAGRWMLERPGAGYRFESLSDCNNLRKPGLWLRKLDDVIARKTDFEKKS
jgi:hypothetical protein